MFGLNARQLAKTGKETYDAGRRIRTARDNNTLFGTDTVKMSRIPLVYSNNEVLFTKMTAIKGHRIPLKSWGFLDEKSKQDYWRGAQGFFGQSFPSDKQNAGQLLVTNRVYSADDWHANLVSDAKETGNALPSLEPYVNYCKDQLDTQEFFETDIYLFTKVGDLHDTGSVKKMLANMFRDVLLSASTDDAPPTDDVIGFWMEKATDVADAVETSWLGAEPLGHNEVEWLYRHLDSPGLPTPRTAARDPEQNASEYWGLGQWSTVLGSFTEEVEIGKTDHKENLRAVEFDGPTGKSYAAYLPVAHVPGRISYDLNWLHHATSLPFPVDASVHFQIIDTERTEKALAKPIRDADAQDDEDSSAGVRQDESNSEQRAELSQLKTAARRNKLSMVYWQAVFSVYDTDKEQLRHKVNQLISHYRKIQFSLVCPREDQRELYYQSLPGNDRLLHDWIQKTDPGYIATAAPWLSTHIGDNKGLYQGYTLVTDTQGQVHAGAPFFYDIFNVADDDGKAPTEAVSGFPGSGKTVSRGLKCALEDAMKGVTQFIWDPKGDFRPLYDRAGQMHLNPDLVNLIDLDDSKSSVSLDAFSVAEVDRSDPNPEEWVDDRHSLAMRILEALLTRSVSGEGKESMLARQYLRLAVSRVLAIEEGGGEPASMLGVVQLLKNWGEDVWLHVADKPDDENLNEVRLYCRAMHEELYDIRKSKLGRLLFKQAVENTRGMVITPGSMTIFVAMGLKVLQPGETPDQATRISDIIASLMTDYIRSLLSNKSIELEHKSAVFDEWHAIRRSAGAEGLMNWLRRMGRSRRCSVRQMSQSAGDFDKGSLSTVWCGKVENDEEALLSCDLLGIEPTDINKMRLMNLQAGQFLFRDSLGRVAWVYVNIWDPRLREWFNTQAKARKALREREGAA